MLKEEEIERVDGIKLIKMCTIQAGKIPGFSKKIKKDINEFKFSNVYTYIELI